MTNNREKYEKTEMESWTLQYRNKDSMKTVWYKIKIKDLF